MRSIYSSIAIGAVCFFTGCSSLNAPAGISDPPLPSTQSICPLIIGSSWEYWSTWYDSSGAKVQLTNRTLTRRIPDGYFLGKDNTLVPSRQYSSFSKNETIAEEYLYKYEWEYLDSGLLVKHTGSGDLDKRGLYIAGEYAHDSVELYEKAVLWLAYPSAKGITYPVALPGRDSSGTVIMEVVETSAGFYAPIENRYGASPVYFRDSCYLYKESIGTTETWYYYHPDIGCLGYLKYSNGKLITSFILKKYVSDSWLY
jgi:hypothetical protein